MKKIVMACVAAFIHVAFSACNNGPADDTVKTELNITGENYTVVYSADDAEFAELMTDMIGKIETASGVKLPSTVSTNPAIECEIQFGLKSDRAESETVYNEIMNFTDGVYCAYSIRVLENKVVIAASNKAALKFAAERFASMASAEFIVSTDFEETGILETKKARRGEYEPIYDFKSCAELSSLLVNGKAFELTEGKMEYIRSLSEGSKAPTITGKSKYPGASVEVTGQALDYEIKVTSNDGTNEEVYRIHFVETAPLDSYSLDTWILPYWDGSITYHESVLFVGDDGAPLLYTPETVLSVRSSDLRTEYTEGVDYEVRDGKLYRLEGSSIPHFTWEEFYPESKETSVSGNAYKGSSKPFVFFAEGTYFHRNQVFVTYTHKENENLFVPEKSEKLHKFIDKLEKGEEVNIVFFGDSIAAGANASGSSNTAPGTPRWAQIVTYALQEKYPKAKINYTNTAVSGKETRWGVAEYDKAVNTYEPDLVVLAFGMNDGGKSPQNFISGIKTMTDGILAKNPDCEIALVATMLPHKETTYYANQYLQEDALKKFAEKYECVDVVPMTSVHTSLLEQKRYFDMTGNNVNHPNDFLIRVYAQTILEVLAGE